ncbi:MAG: helix-turn-helix transcriptional regulator [Actinomycetota bacterium]
MAITAEQVPHMAKLLFVEEAAARLRRSPSQLRWMINQGTAPKHAKIAGRICFRESDIEEYIERAFAEAG